MNAALAYQTNQLIKIVLREATLANAAGRAWVTCPVLDGREACTFPIASPFFEGWLCERFVEIHEYAPMQMAIVTAIVTLTETAQSLLPLSGPPWLN